MSRVVARIPQVDDSTRVVPAQDTAPDPVPATHCYESHACRSWNPCSCGCAGCAAMPMYRDDEERRVGCARCDGGTTAMATPPTPDDCADGA